MIREPLLISALFSLASAAIYGTVGFLLNKRATPGKATNFAWKLFIVWWFSLCISTAIGFVFNTLALLGQTNLPVFIALTYFNLLFVCVALWGLLYYLFYIFTGNSRILMHLTLFYLFYYGLLIYYVTVSTPTEVEIGRWDTSLSYQYPLTGPFFILVLALLIVPQFLSAIAYLTLFFKVEGATQKYRILLVSVSIIVWFGSPLIALAGGMLEEDWWQILSRAIGLAAALTILIAYLPPEAIQKRLGVTSIADERG